MDQGSSEEDDEQSCPREQEQELVLAPVREDVLADVDRVECSRAVLFFGNHKNERPTALRSARWWRSVGSRLSLSVELCSI